MGLLANCPKCQSLIMPGQPCPNCHYQENSPESAEKNEEFVIEYTRRKERHQIAYAAYMCRIIGAGITGASAFAAFFYVLYAGRGGGLPGFLRYVGIIMFLLGAAMWGASQVFMAKYRADLEVHCPACDARLDEMPMESGYCPGCNVRLS